MNDQVNPMMQPMIEPAHDVVQLPSKGLYYPNRKAALKVAYLTASDENILTSVNLMESGEMLDMLLERKILDKDLRPSQMLEGDRVAILFWLRATGYGAIYPMKLTDPITKRLFEYEVDLTTLQYKEDLITPNDAGLCEFMLPVSKKKVLFKFLSGAEIQRINKDDEARQSKLGKKAFSTLMTTRLAAAIHSIDGITDRGEIAQFVDNMSVKDSGDLRKYMNDHEPGLDLKIEVAAPSGSIFQANVAIATEFFWPYL
jgi:hypothetical protein